jgi:spermidine synthase
MRLPPARASLLAFVTAAYVLFMQILVHRVVSAKLLNNYAFLIISLTMLGFALSGLLLSFALPRLLARLEETVSVSAALMVLCTLGATLIFYRTDVDQMQAERVRLAVSFLKTLPQALSFAFPFAFAGLILGTLLAAPDLPSRRVYFYDLLGSGLGAFAVIPAIYWLGVEGSLLLACGILLAVTLVLVPPRSGLARAASAVALLALAACSLRPDAAFAMRYPRGTPLRFFQEAGGPFAIETVRWDPVARIEVSRIAAPQPERDYYPSLIGSNPAFHQLFQRMLTQNNNAFTYALAYDGQPASLRGIEETIYSAAYQAQAVARPRVGIIGVGGGFDVLTAIHFDASEVTGVEINAATVSLARGDYREKFGRWVDDPRVRLVLGEGRHYLATHPERFDVLQLSGVDSVSGTAAAAHVFSENYLSTNEAFDLFLARLTDQGILNMMRLEYPAPREMLRALVSAVSALRRAGAERPADHIVMLSAEPDPNFTAMLVKRTPFRPEEVDRLAAWAGRSPWFEVWAAPGRRVARDNAYQAFLALGDPRREGAFVAGYPYDISPTGDDRPFFFKYSFWWHVLPQRSSIALAPPIMEDSVLILLAVIGLCVVGCVYLPLRYLARTGAFAPATRRYGVFFAATGLGYLAIEIALLQKFGLFLGHPNLALSVVLAALLISTGLGSLLSERIVAALGNLRFVAYLLSALILVEYLLVMPRLPGLITLPFSLRVLIVTALVAPPGLCLGTFFPSALESLKSTAPSYAPWAWGLNGIFSVLSPVLSVAVSMTWGMGALLLAAIPVYLAAALALPSPTGARP